MANVIFTQRKGKRGYDERQVDYYLNECVQLLTRLESYARVADFVGEPSESAMTAANPSATSLASQETQVVSPLFAVPAVSAEPIAQPAQVQNSTDSFDALNKAEREIFTTPATSPVSIPATQTAAPTYAPVVPPVFQPTISTPSAPVTPAAPVTPEPQAAPVAPAAPEQSLAHLFTASNAVDEEPSSAGTETEAFNPLSDDGAPSYDAPAAPAAPVIPDTSVAHQPEESHGITIAPDSSLAALAQMAQNIDAPDPVEDTFTPRMPSLSTPNLPQVNTDSINLGTLPTVPPSFTLEPATSADHSTTATPVEPAKPAEEEKKNETKPATNPMFEASNSNLDVDIPDLSFPSFE